MKNKMLVLEHGNKMYYSKEIIQLNVPKEISLMFYAILSLFLIVIVLISFCSLDDVIKVKGSVRTMHNNSTVKNVIAGKISAIHYSPEEYVEKGDLLYSIDPELHKTTERELRIKLKDCEEQLSCMNILFDGVSCGRKKGFVKNELADSKLNEYFGNVAYFEQEKNILEYRLLKEENQPESLYNRQNVNEARMNYDLCSAEFERYKAGFLAEIVQKKKNLELEKEGIFQELVRTLEQAEFLEVRAPVSGFVQEVALLNEGDYLSAEQVVLVIVADDSENFKIEMSVPTKDIGEIVPEMTVKYRLSAFPFFEYKGAEGKILYIDSDVREGSDGRMYYRVYADIDRSIFTSKQGNSYSIKAGIEVDARIVKEKISVVHFIFRKLDFLQ